MPVFLLWVLSKRSRGNFTDAETAQMRSMAKATIDHYRTAQRGGRISDGS